jgi:CubicO group peptidase (beta-lactamase class C family)
MRYPRLSAPVESAGAILLTAALGLAGCAPRGPAAATGTGSGPVAATSPSGPWRQYATPAEAGFDSTALAAVCDYADSVQSSALMAVYRGHVVLACGDVDRKLEAHSVRKSMLSALYGTAVAPGEIDLDATLDQLGIDDDAGLTELEKSAAVRDIISARGGVYLPAAYASSDQDENRPERGSHPPGSHWFYNNWDFNVAGVIYEQATGEDLYEAFDRRIAEPLGMEDYEPEDGFRVYEPTASRHPAHTFRVSARDLARVGQLYLQEGRWGDRQILSPEWIRESTSPVSDFGSGRGYGYMWWTYAAGSVSPETYPALADHDSYMARGTGGQAVWVIPDADLVIVHRADTDHGRSVGGRDAWTMADRIVGARVGMPDSEPRLAAVDPVPLESQLEPYRFPDPTAVSAGALDEYMGEYVLAPQAVIRVFRFQGDPYMLVPGEGEGQLIPTGEDTFTVRVVAGVRVVFLRDEAGAVRAVELTLGPQTMRAAKR